MSHFVLFYKDLQTLLTEVNGDVQIAATRITEGMLYKKNSNELGLILFQGTRNNGARSLVKKTRNNLLLITQSKTHSPRAEEEGRVKEVGEVDVEEEVVLVEAVEPLVVDAVGQGEVRMAMLSHLQHRLPLSLKLPVPAGCRLPTLGLMSPTVRPRNQRMGRWKILWLLLVLVRQLLLRTDGVRWRKKYLLHQQNHPMGRPSLLQRQQPQSRNLPPANCHGHKSLGKSI